MSKILDLLNYNNSREAARNKKEAKNFSPDSITENFDASTKEKLADTYIFNPIDKIEDIEGGLDKETLLHNYNMKTKKVGFAQFFPWIITFLAVLLLLVNIVYRGTINFKIEVVDKDSLGSAHALQPVVTEPAVPAAVRGVLPQATSEVLPGQAKPAPIESVELPADLPPVSTVLIAERQTNRYVIKRVGFYGAALTRSRLTEDGLFLHNDGKTGWASAGLDLAQPMDLSYSTLDFFAKGANGNESLEIFLRDSENRSYMPQAYNLIFKKNMGKDWQFVSVPLNNFIGDYNPKKINHLGFEFGTQTTLNEPGVSIYIKKLKIVESNRTSYKKALDLNRSASLDKAILELR